MLLKDGKYLNKALNIVSSLPVGGIRTLCATDIDGFVRRVHDL